MSDYHPTPADIIAARRAAGLTQAQAAKLAGLNSRTRWIEYEKGRRTPETGRWELFLLRAGLHPDFVIRPRPGASAQP